MNFVGRSVPRLEDRPLVTGQRPVCGRRGLSAHAPYAGGAFGLRAWPHLSHRYAARRWRCRASSRSGPSADVADIPPIDFRLTRIEGLAPYRQPILARQRVRYVGEPVAAVFADDPYLAEDAADLVDVEIEELPVILDADAAPGRVRGRPLDRAGDRRKVLRRPRRGVSPGACGGRARARRSAAIPACRWKRAAPSRATTPPATCSKCTAPPRCRTGIATASPACSAAILSTVHLFEGHVGGGFGIRGELYPEDVLVCLAALRLGRPVKWIEDRREHLIAANHSRQQRHEVRAAVDARRPHPRASTTNSSTTRAAMCAPTPRTVPDLAAGMLPGPYRVPAYRAVGHVRLTNKTPGGTYRAPGRYESTFVRERLMDAIATRLGHRSRRGPPAQSASPKRRCRIARPLATLGHRHRARFRRLCRPARQGAGSASSWNALQDELAAPPRRRRMRRRGPRALRREERARPVRRRADHRRSSRVWSRW